MGDGGSWWLTPAIGIAVIIIFIIFLIIFRKTGCKHKLSRITLLQHATAAYIN